MSIDFKSIKKAVDALAKLTDEEQEAIMEFIGEYAVLKDHEMTRLKDIYVPTIRMNPKEPYPDRLCVEAVTKDVSVNPVYKEAGLL